MASKALIPVILVLLALVVGVIVFLQFGPQGTDTGASQGEQTSPSLGAEEEQQTQETPPEMQPVATAFLIEADDRGFYIDGNDVSSISDGSGEALKITFNVRTQNVYYGGLDFRGCGFLTEKVSPGGSIIVEFTPTSTCTITSYWPSSNRVKDRLQVVVG